MLRALFVLMAVCFGTLGTVMLAPVHTKKTNQPLFVASGYSAVEEIDPTQTALVAAMDQQHDVHNRASVGVFFDSTKNKAVLLFRRELTEADVRPR